MLADISKFYPPTHVKTQNTFWLPWIISILICLTVQIRWYTLEDDNLYLHLRTMSHTIVPRSLVLYVCFVDRCLSFCPFSFGHCVVCSSIYGFWLPFWYLQTLHVAKFEQTTIHQHVLLRRESQSHILLRPDSQSYWWSIRNNNIVFACFICTSHIINFGHVDYFQWILMLKTLTTV